MSQLSPAARAAALLALVVWIPPSLADPGQVDEGGEIHQPPLIASEAMEVAPAAPRVDAPGEIHAATPTRPASPEVVELAPEVPPLADGSKPTGITTVPVTGAFGLRLGEPFDPDQVAMVLGERPQTYRGPEGAERAGTRYQVEPLQPSPCFQTYSVNTTRMAESMPSAPTTRTSAGPRYAPRPRPSPRSWKRSTAGPAARRPLASGTPFASPSILSPGTSPSMPTVAGGVPTASPTRITARS